MFMMKCMCIRSCIWTGNLYVYTHRNPYKKSDFSITLQRASWLQIFVVQRLILSWHSTASSQQPAASVCIERTFDTSPRSPVGYGGVFFCCCHSSCIEPPHRFIIAICAIYKSNWFLCNVSRLEWTTTSAWVRLAARSGACLRLHMCSKSQLPRVLGTIAKLQNNFQKRVHISIRSKTTFVYQA